MRRYEYRETAVSYVDGEKVMFSFIIFTLYGRAEALSFWDSDYWYDRGCQW